MKTELVTSLKRKATDIIAKLSSHREPVLITEHGKPAAYLVDVISFEAQQNKIKILEGIARGERAIAEGRTVDHKKVRERLKKWQK